MSQTLNVLHVEDEEYIAEIVRRCLEPEGFCLTWVRTQVAARQLFDELDRFGGVIVDGNVDGSTVSLIHELRERMDRPKFIFALTGEGSDVLKEMILRHGCDWGLTKPFNVSELVQWFCEQRDARTRAPSST